MNVISSFEDGTFLTRNNADNQYHAYDAWGNFLESSDDVFTLHSKYFDSSSVNRPGENNFDVYQNYIIQNFRKYAQLKDYPASNLLDMLNQAASLTEDFYISLSDGRVYQTTFKYLLKISNGKDHIWMPDTLEEVKALEEFCLKRRKEHE